MVCEVELVNEVLFQMSQGMRQFNWYISIDGARDIIEPKGVVQGADDRFSILFIMFIAAHPVSAAVPMIPSSVGCVFSSKWSWSLSLAAVKMSSVCPMVPKGECVDIEKGLETMVILGGGLCWLPSSLNERCGASLNSVCCLVQPFLGPCMVQPWPSEHIWQVFQGGAFPFAHICVRQRNLGHCSYIVLWIVHRILTSAKFQLLTWYTGC